MQSFIEVVDGDNAEACYVTLHNIYHTKMNVHYLLQVKICKYKKSRLTNRKTNVGQISV